MGGIGRQVGGQAVHADIVTVEIIQCPIHVFQRDLQMRVLLPAPGVVAFDVRSTHQLDWDA
jgi:hypothetical protein